MGTNFYLADARYMTQSEIECAEHFDQNALVCHRSGTKEGMVYSLGVHPICFFNLPRDTRLINDNCSDIASIGDLFDAITKEGAILKTPPEVQKESNEQIKEWLLSLPDIGGWAIFRDEKKAVANGASADSLFTPQPTAEQYLKRKHKPRY